MLNNPARKQKVFRTMFFIALFLLVYLIKACFFIQALCIAFAPFAALISNYIAWRRNLPIVRYALLGALGAACFIMPWIYLIQRMRNKPISLETANAAYTILYALWFFVLLGDAMGNNYLDVSDRVPGSAWWVLDIKRYIPMLVGLAMWAATWVLLARRGVFSRDTDTLPLSEIAHWSRIAPFVGASATIAVITYARPTAYIWPDIILQWLRSL